MALRHILTISVGGERVELRTLTLAESDAWLLALADATTEALPSAPDGAKMQAADLLTIGSRLALRLVEAYDVDGVLGDRIDSMSKMEVKAALDAMAEAEDPFGEGASRLVVAVYGPASTLLGRATSKLLEARGLGPPREKSPRGASARGGSTTTGTSTPPGPASSSSSSTPTGDTSSGSDPATTVTPSPTA
jgi:hypothetical protein